MTNPGTAVATAAQNAAAKPPDTNMQTEIVTIAGRGEIERITASITIPPDFQYAIDKWVRDDERGVKADGSPYFKKEVQRVGLTIDAYDYINRVLGVSFFFPDLVPDANGKMVPNPIWQPPDFTTVLMGAVWLNPMGQHLVSYELVSTDFWRIYQDKRANSLSARLMEPPDFGEGDAIVPTFDKRGDMNLTLLPDDEMKAYKELTRMRALGPRYAQTVGRVRLLKIASGIRSLPIKSVHAYPLTVTGFRDQMDARERVQKVAETAQSFYGRPVDERAAFASGDEMAEAGHEDDEGPIEPVVEPAKPFTTEELRQAGIE